ncbi:hypothetical protein GPECTOR_57g472 [Gonium pectorale]|uniref:SGNH hydrolase-type esterase domain-containing protein n=1 Tax=Gonium pectorale TaxID=33097 RepID=A0A150G5Q4_GONPE|nr:hypothetical protein GPECTOR_57g472 [Gonium pectorale]|eukprot:KXZ45182.1 hypothetical protein GPECTOR_57g472 [Gonium pectorale]
MESRLPSLLARADARDTPYSWVVVLGGINDIGSGADPGRVFQGLRALYAASRAHGARVLALTCLPTAYADMDKPRKRLNAMIRAAAMPLDDGGSSDVSVLDLEELLPFPRDSSDPAAELWDDGLHLTPAGYDRLGTLVFEALRDQIGQRTQDGVGTLGTLNSDPDR